MKEYLQYEQPKVEVIKVQVEVGFFGTYNPPYSGGGGGTISDPSTSGGATAEDWEIIYGTWD